jgi:hypothetical protein
MIDIFDSEKHSGAKAIGSSLPTIKKEKKLKSLISKPPKGKKRHKLSGHSHSPLSTFCYWPDHVEFINKDPEEEVVLLLRKHLITNLRWVILAFFMIIAPSFLPILSFFEFLPFRFQVFLVVIWYLVTTAFVLEKFLSWYFHVSIITDERIIEVDFPNLIYREITDANIDQIQDVTVEVGGASRTFLHYGNIIIQTAAQIPKLEFEAVPHPDKVAKILRELRIEEEIEKLEGRVR